MKNNRHEKWYIVRINGSKQLRPKSYIDKISEDEELSVKIIRRATEAERKSQ